MLRSAIARHGALYGGARSHSTGLPTGAPTRPTPGQPPSAPAGHGSGAGRKLFVALAASAIAVGYGMHTNDGLRHAVEEKVPGASKVLSAITSKDYSKGKAQGEVGEDTALKSTLPPHFDSVQGILDDIKNDKEGSRGSGSGLGNSQDGVALADAETVNSSLLELDPTGVNASALDALSDPTHPSAEASGKQAPNNSDGAAAKDEVPQMKLSKPFPPENVEPRSDPEALAPESAASSSFQGTSTKDNGRGGASSNGSVSERNDAKAGAKDNEERPKEEGSNAKTRLARIFGKGGDVSEASRPKRSVHESSGPASRTAGDVAEVELLRRELESQAQWNAVRIQKAVHAQMIHDRKKAAREIAAITKKHMETLETAKAEALDNAHRMLEIRTREIERATAARRDRELKEMLAQKEGELRTTIATEFLEKEKAETLEREAKLTQAKAKVSAIAGEFQKILLHNKALKDAAMTSSAAFAFCDAASKSTPFDDQLATIATKTELASAVASSIPKDSVAKGIPTISELQERFGTVSRKGLNAAMVPDYAAGTVWGHMLGTLAARLKIRVFDVPQTASSNLDFAPAKTDEERIRQAQAFVEAGNMAKAAEVLEGLGQLSAEIVSDWVSDARARYAADQAARVLFADATIAQVALATRPPAKSDLKQ